MVADDVGCHVAALCAQAIEKSLKGYVYLNGATPAFDHRPDKYVVALLRGEPLLSYADHRAKLSKLFDATTKEIVTKLLDLTPGGLGNRNDVANTEYPWVNAGSSIAPTVALEFGDITKTKARVETAKRVSSALHKLWIAVDRASAI